MVQIYKRILEVDEEIPKIASAISNNKKKTKKINMSVSIINIIKFIDDFFYSNFLNSYSYSSKQQLSEKSSLKFQFLDLNSKFNNTRTKKIDS